MVGLCWSLPNTALPSLCYLLKTSCQVIWEPHQPHERYDHTHCAHYMCIGVLGSNEGLCGWLFSKLANSLNLAFSVNHFVDC